MGMNPTNEKIEAIPQEIRSHLRKLVESLEMADGEEGFQRLAGAWLEKEKLFSAQTANLDMQPMGKVPDGDERGMLLLTNSGSLLSLWPAKNGARAMEYASIALRSDVPDILKGDKIRIEGGVERGRPVEVSGGPLKKTSPIYLIALCSADLSIDEQEKRVREATIFLTNGFTRINRKTQSREEGQIEHFTKQAMISYIAQRSDLTQKEIRQIIDDYLTMVETGALLGESVNIGRLGRLSVKLKAAQKARVGRNPATGEELTIPAKPAHGVPKFSFSSYLKDRAAEVEFEEES